MLVLTRRPGETIKIGADIDVCILKALNGRVSIGVSAPENVIVLRGEPGQPPARRPGAKRLQRMQWAHADSRADDSK